MRQTKRYYCKVCQPSTGCRQEWLTGSQMRKAKQLGHEVRQVGFACPEWEEERRYLDDPSRPPISLDDVLDVMLALRAPDMGTLSG